MTNGVCTPYKFEEEFQRIRDFVAQFDPGSTVNVQEWDVRPPSRVIISGTAYQEVVDYVVPADKAVFLYEIHTSLIGFSSEVVVERFDLGVGWSLIRSYALNTQQLNYSERLTSPVALLDVDETTIIRVRAKMNASYGDNANGSVFAALNGFICPKP